MISTPKASHAGAEEQQAAEAEGQAEQVTSGAVRYAAMSLLARREHSRLELRQKLNRRFDAPELIDTVIQNLADEALQSEDRFAEAFVNMRRNRGQGPVRIINELQMRGIPEAIYSRYVDPGDEDWRERARDICLRKYGSLASKPAQQAKQMRFLQYRGFTAEQIRSLWRNVD
ncbi:regulatory protein RecX [Gilvimarinus sp. F26214L]|uniref:regulatory protein RecX n=1 Tax=Gilvimarinus sp. DZF01 TaxID=3461371 RepID=UPI0040452303